MSTAFCRNCVHWDNGEYQIEFGWCKSAERGDSLASPVKHQTISPENAETGGELAGKLLTHARFCCNAHERKDEE